MHRRAAFMSSGQSYGSRRFVTALANGGLLVGRYKMRRLMQQASLKPVWKRKFVHTTDSKHAPPIAPNVLAGQFNPAAPNLAYVSDITYIRTGAGWLYLAVVLDLFSRRVVGWAMAPGMPATLVCESKQAFANTFASRLLMPASVARSLPGLSRGGGAQKPGP
jgi:transposase InsO family protein